jgi:hypothetical protein
MIRNHKNHKYLCRDYTTINNLEQKRRYKEEFIANYGEYCILHSEVAMMSKHFEQMYREHERYLSLGNKDAQEVSYRKHKIYSIII